MENKHTPGPWQFSKSDISGNYAIYANGPLAYTAGPADYGDRAEANARLIAAAPKLLEELQMAEDMLRYAAQEAVGKVAKSKREAWIYQANRILRLVSKIKQMEENENED